jgi:hypothetical protein
MAGATVKGEGDQGFAGAPGLVSKLLPIYAVFDDQFHRSIKRQA